MVLKFKSTSVIFVMILAVIIALSVFILTRPNRDMMVTTIIFTVLMLAAAAVVTLLFARSVARQLTGAANTLRGLAESDDDFITRIIGNSEDETDAFGGTVSGIQSATTTLVKNNVSVKGLIESYETGLSGMQGIMTELREIVNSLDNMLQESEVNDMSQGHD
jgi:energy-converting hydrogenase Eha subunit A